MRCILRLAKVSAAHIVVGKVEDGPASPRVFCVIPADASCCDLMAVFRDNVYIRKLGGQTRSK